MTDTPAAAPGKSLLAAANRLLPGVIGVGEDTVLGMAWSAPAATLGGLLGALAAATAYGSGPILLLTAIPMLIIANAYRRLNLWNANTGASFEWVGRAINPYLGFLTGWLMIAAYVIGTVSGMLLLEPSVLAVFGSSSASVAAYTCIGLAVGLIMLGIAVAGIKITARVQVGMTLLAYPILIALAITGLVYVLSHHTGMVPFSKGWLSVSGINGKGGVAAGFLVAVFAYSGWEGTLYVNEEVRHRHVNPGRAAILAVALLAIVYTLSQVGFQGVVSPGRLRATSDNGTALVTVAHVLGGGFGARMMALSIALSVIAATGIGIVFSARIVYGMASYRVLPESLATVSPRFGTPVAASVAVGVPILFLSAFIQLVSSTQNAFLDVLEVTGLLFLIFYILTALAAITYYRRRIVSSPLDFLTVGLLPLGAVAFLAWIVVKSLGSAPWSQRWSLIGIVVAGLIVMAYARLILRSPFFHVQLESADSGAGRGRTGQPSRFEVFRAYRPPVRLRLETPARRRARSQLTPQPQRPAQREDAESLTWHVIIRAEKEEDRQYAAKALHALGFEPVKQWSTRQAISFRIDADEPGHVQRQLQRTPFDWKVVPPDLDYVLSDLRVEVPDGREFHLAGVPGQQRVQDIAAYMTGLYGSGPASTLDSVSAELVRADGQKEQLDITLPLAQVVVRDGDHLRFRTQELTEDRKTPKTDSCPGQADSLLPDPASGSSDVELTERQFDQAGLTVIHLVAGGTSATLELHRGYFTYYWESQITVGDFARWVEDRQDSTLTSIMALDRTGQIRNLSLETASSITGRLQGEGPLEQWVLLRLDGAERSWVWQIALDTTADEADSATQAAYAGCASNVHYYRDFAQATDFLINSAVDGQQLALHIYLFHPYLRRLAESNDELQD